MNQVNIVKRTVDFFCPACGDHTSSKLAQNQSLCNHVIYTFDDETKEFQKVRPSVLRYIEQVVKSQKKQEQRFENAIAKKKNLEQTLREIQTAPTAIDELSELMWSISTMHVGIEVMNTHNTQILYIGYNFAN